MGEGLSKGGTGSEGREASRFTGSGNTAKTTGSISHSGYVVSILS